MNGSNCGNSLTNWGLSLGGVLAIGHGLRSRSLTGAVLALGGGYLVYRGLRGLSPRTGQVSPNRLGAGVTAGIYDQVAIAAKEERHSAGTYIEDVVEEASDDSFPCSDPPAWTARS